MNTKQWLTKLVGFDTTSRNSNLSLIGSVKAWFEQNNLETHVIVSKSGEKANLFATIPSQDGKTQGGILLSGHTDVVPVDGQIWHTNPFEAVEMDNKIFGRGTADMKGFLAVMLSLVPEFLKLELKKPIHFCFSFDEEIGCLGAPLIVEHIHSRDLQPEACIVGEPSSMHPIIGYKARQTFHCQVTGLATHSSLAHQGCNAIEYASRLICYIRSIAEHLREQGPYDEDFDVPFTTITVNLVSGGYAFNIIPANCEFMFEIRHLPNFSLENVRGQIENFINETLLPEMRKTYSEAAIHLDLTSSAPGFDTQMDVPIVHLVQTITGVKERLKVSYSTEAGLFQRAGIPTIICGPGNIEQAHGANEFISVEQLVICENVLRNIIQFVCVA